MAYKFQLGAYTASGSLTQEGAIECDTSLTIGSAAMTEADLEKCIILTGAMVPYAIDPVEAAANLASAFGYLQALKDDGIYIAMNGVFGTYNKVKKDRENGRFIFHN